MRNRKVFSFNEEKDAEKIILNGFPNGEINYNEMYVIAKYFREMFGYGEIRLERELIRFCKNQDKNFNPVLNAELIRKWINSAMNYSLRKIENVIISQEEVDFLKKISIPKHRKLLFVLLIFSKALKKRSTRHKKGDFKKSDNYYIHYNNFNDIIKLSRVKNLTEAEFADILSEYKNNFYFYKPEKELIRVDFVDKFPKTKIIINKLDAPMEYYDLFFSENRHLVFCIDCGEEITKNSNSQERCKKCSSIRRKEKQKELMRHRRLLEKTGESLNQ